MLGLRRVIGLDTTDSYDLSDGCYDEEHPARLALVVRVRSSLRLLVALVLESLVLAVGHWYCPADESILAFAGTPVPGGASA